MTPASLASHDIAQDIPKEPRPKTRGARSQAIGERPAPARVSKGPEIRPFSEWDAGTCLNDDDRAMKQASALDLNDAPSVASRALLINQLLAALDRGDTASLLDHLKDIPPTVQRFDLYFPPAPIRPPAPVEHGYQHLVERATRLDDEQRTLSTLRLLMLLTDCKDRLETQVQLTERFKSVPDAQLDRKFAPEVQDACFALRDMHAFNLIMTVAPRTEEANPAKAITAPIAKAMRPERESLVTELATQPFANLRMLQAKCTILAAVDAKHSDTIIGFRQKVEAALELQQHCSTRLREQLLERPVNKREVAMLALLEHAKQSTTLPIDYVCAGASWDDIRTMHRNIRDVLTYYVEQHPEDSAVEQVALDWVARQIRSTTQLPH